MRVVKEAEERRNEILDAADELFAQKGFDGTSTNDILEKVGIARGTLYYHFKSKEAIMDALIERYTTQVLTAAKKAAEDYNIAVGERIVRVVMAMNLKAESKGEIMEHIHKPQNALMHQKIQKAMLTGVTPILTEVVREGIDKAIFNTPFPYQAVEMIMTYTGTIFDDDMGPMPENDMTRVRAFIFNAERLLGAENGSLMCVMQLFEKSNINS
ncbi:TetR/AcrR family transcriptional regulator [Oscillospiraceae bacterium PP1C4]